MGVADAVVTSGGLGGCLHAFSIDCRGRDTYLGCIFHMGNADYTTKRCPRWHILPPSGLDKVTSDRMLIWPRRQKFDSSV
jgi:hypothetical protein